MRYTDNRFHMHVEINASGTDVPEDQMIRMQQALEPLGERLAEFPESRLWLKIVFHSRSLTHHVQAKLKVPGRTIITGAHHEFLDTAFEAAPRGDWTEDPAGLRRRGLPLAAGLPGAAVTRARS